MLRPNSESLCQQDAAKGNKLLLIHWQDTSIMLHPSVPFFHIAAIAVYCLLLLHLWNHPSKVRWNQPKSPWLWRTWLACPRQFLFSAAAECKCMRKRGGRWISILLGDCWTKSWGFQALQWPCHTLSTFSNDCLKNLYQSAHVQRFRSFFSNILTVINSRSDRFQPNGRTSQAILKLLKFISFPCLWFEFGAWIWIHVCPSMSIQCPT